LVVAEEPAQAQALAQLKAEEEQQRVVVVQLMPLLQEEEEEPNQHQWQYRA
jgi:hypothetical protein